MCLAAVVTYLSIGIVVMCIAEGWSFIDSFYFSVTTLTTVGYGDLLPTTDGSKIFIMFFVFIGIGLVGAALGVVGTWVMDQQDELAKQLAEQTGLDDGDDSNDWF